MDIAVNADPKQITPNERELVNKQVKAELIEHLYQGCLPGVIAGVPVGIFIFADYYGYTPTHLLIPWYILYNLSLLALSGLYFYYRSQLQKHDLKTWLMLYSVFMSFCAIMWGLSIYLIPENLTRQYFAFIALFLITTGYATGSIGVFELCAWTLAIIIIPLIIWCFYQASLFYFLLGGFSVIYYFFMCSINARSTQWFKSSLILKLENNLVSYQANHDPLTDLPNQRLLIQFIGELIKLSKENNEYFAVVCFSPNRLTIINDSLGHQAGDLILQAIANRLRALADKYKNIKDQPVYKVTISRQDTFVILLAPIKPNQIQFHIQQIFSVLTDPFYLEKQGIIMTASIGVSIFSQDGTEVQTLLTNADAAMLKAKQFGGNRFELYRAEITASLPQQVELENDLYNALKKNEFTVYYQPLVSVKDGSIIGSEALIRWQHPTQGFISPAKFIPLAEETGLIVPLGEWILDQACKQTKAWHDIGFSTVKVAVNVAERQLREGNIIPIIKRSLKNSGLEAKFLELEITETAILDESIIPLIKEFKKLGLSLSIDDFGTGYSGLSYFKQFSIDKIKIDQSFVKDIPQNNDSMTIVSAILAMAKELNVATLAEGVETQEQLSFLAAKGCDYVQGFFMSKPVPADLFNELLKNEPFLTQREKLLEES